MSNANIISNDLSTIKHKSVLFAHNTMVKVVYDEIAVRTSLNESIMLGQINYWLQRCQDDQHYRDGRYWIWKTYDEWVEELPFWSKTTIRTIIKSLKNRKLIIVGQYNKMLVDKTSWYTIDYNALDRLCQQDILSKKDRKYQSDRPPCVRNEQSMCQMLTHGSVRNRHMDVSDVDTPITKDYTKITSKTTSKTTSEWSNFDEAKNCPPTTGLEKRLKHIFGDDDETIKEMSEVIEYFFWRYLLEKGEPHEYIVSDVSFQLPTIKLSEVVASVGVELTKDIIDRYFKSIKPQYWSYWHIGTDGILKNRLYETGHGQAEIKGIIGV